MNRDREYERLETLIDIFERSVLEASDEEVLATGGGTEAAEVLSRALRARNFQMDGSRRIAPRKRSRRAAIASQVRSLGGVNDMTKVRAQFSDSGDSTVENDEDDPDLA